MTEPPVAWQELAARLHPFVARRVPPSDIDDVLQDVLLRIHRGLPALRDEERFAGWMFRLARTAIADHGRVLGRHPNAEPPPGDEAEPDDDDDRATAIALSSCLALFVARLPSPYREAVSLVELEGLTAREAAELLGVSLPAMKARVLRGRAQLRAALDACCVIAVDARGKVTDFTPRREAWCSCSRSTDDDPAN
ncbi:MAG TPA: sigma-70 family RNA polymerase sigma factor [Kofleriaceae bacterium]